MLSRSITAFSIRRRQLPCVRERPPRSNWARVLCTCTECGLALGSRTRLGYPTLCPETIGWFVGYVDLCHHPMRETSPLASLERRNQSDGSGLVILKSRSLLRA